MFYTYILINEKDDKIYVGYTDNLKRRIKQHNNGDVESTKYRRLIKIDLLSHIKHQTPVW